MTGLFDSRKGLLLATILTLGGLATACGDDSESQNVDPSQTGDAGNGFPPSVGGATGGAAAGTAGGPGGLWGGTSGGQAGGGNAGPAGGNAGLAGGNAGLGGAFGGAAGMAGGGAAGGGTTGAAGGGGALPCEIKTIVDQKCGTCHKNPVAFGAPMPLVTLADFQAPGKTDPSKKAHELVKARLNVTGPGQMPPPPTTLSAAELETLNQWLDSGAGAGTSCTTTPGGGPGGAPGGGMTGGNPTDTTGLECYKFVAHAQGSKTAKYPVGVARDQYIAMGFAAPWRGTVYAQVIKPVIDNENAIHHWLLYEELTTDGSISTSIGQHAGGELLTGWAPGGEPFDFRIHGDVGLEMPPSSYVLELHYNSSDPSAQDASGAEVCVKTSKPEHVAAQSWLGYDELVFPSTSWTGTCNPGHTQPIKLLFVTPHMHQAGTHMKGVINGPNGSRVLHDKPFNFEYQVTYPVNDTLMPGETITTTCTFSEPKSFGQATSDEMCYLFTYYYPAGLLVDPFPYGAWLHTVKEFVSVSDVLARVGSSD